MARILLIDDSDVDRRVLQDFLESAGHDVKPASSGSEGLRAMWELRPDIVLLDVIMPGMDGWMTCSRIREISETPIIMLTSLNREDEIVRGLELGADDFLSKPVSLKQLGARILAVLRRSQREPPASNQDGVIYDDGGLRVDVDSHEVRLQGRLLDLSPTEFRLLAALARAPGRLQTYSSLLSQVWGPEYVDDVEFLRVYVSRLRQKVEPDPARATRIITERGFGYRLSRP